MSCRSCGEGHNSITDTSIGISNVIYHIETYWADLIQIAVPIFFMISGLLFFRTFEISMLLSKWKKRFFTILIPYLIWCTLYYLYFVLCTHVPAIRSVMNNPGTVELSLPDWIPWLWTGEYYTLWFLQNLIIYILLTPVIWALLKNHFKKIPTGFIALIVILVILSKHAAGIPYSYGIVPYLVGCYIGLNCREALYKKNKIISIIALVYIAIILVSSFKIWNTLTESLFYISIWFALDLVKLTDRKLPWWMSITFFTYVAHDVFLQCFSKIFLKVLGTKAILAIIGYVFMPLLVELVLILIAYILKKWIPVVWCVVTGGR